MKAPAAQKIKFSIKVNKCDQIHRKLRIWSYLLKKSLTENFIFYAVALDRILPNSWLTLQRALTVFLM